MVIISLFDQCADSLKKGGLSRQVYACKWLRTAATVAPVSSRPAGCGDGGAGAAEAGGASHVKKAACPCQGESARGLLDAPE